MNKTAFSDNQALRSRYRAKETQPYSRNRSSPGSETTSNASPQSSTGQAASTASNPNLENMCLQMVSKWFVKNITARCTGQLNAGQQSDDKSKSTQRHAPGSLRKGSSRNHPKSEGLSEQEGTAPPGSLTDFVSSADRT